jgi:uncharacterized protein YbbK (DUF523 family)
MRKLKIGLSRCLIGDRVRYDGQLKAMPGFYHRLSEQFELIPFCPEVEAGMGVPRPPIQIVERDTVQYLYLRDDPNPTQDFADLIASQVDRNKQLFSTLSGFILMQRSPSCGIQSTPVFDSNGREIRTGAGLFVQRLQQLFPDLPIEEAANLEDENRLAEFLRRVESMRSASMG